MKEKHKDEFKEQMLHRGFIAEDRAYQIRMDYEPGRMLPDTESVKEFKKVVQDEVERMERSLNLVASVVVDGYRVDAVFIVGETADKDIITQSLEAFQNRVYESALQRCENDRPSLPKVFRGVSRRETTTVYLPGM